MRLSFPPRLPSPASSTRPGHHVIGQGQGVPEGCLLDQGCPSSSEGLSMCCWGNGVFGPCCRAIPQVTLLLGCLCVSKDTR